MQSAPKDGTIVDLMYPYPRGRKINCKYNKTLGWHWLSETFDPNTLEVLPESEWNINCLPNMEPLAWMPTPPYPSIAIPGKSEIHPDIPYVLYGCKCSLCQRFGSIDNQLTSNNGN